MGRHIPVFAAVSDPSGPSIPGGWGVIGYAIFLVGAKAEIVGIHIGPILLIPGGLFELAFAFWLLIKGFEPAAHRAQPVMDSPA